jgi:hypothetical protein
LNAFLPSPLASPNSDKSGLNVDKLGETDMPEVEADIVAFPSEKNDLAKLEPTWSELKLAEREGFEPPVPLRARLISSQVR